MKSDIVATPSIYIYNREIKKDMVFKMCLRCSDIWIIKGQKRYKKLSYRFIVVVYTVQISPGDIRPPTTF